MLCSPSEHLGVARVPDCVKPSHFDTVAYIPARLASERVPRKNLRLLGDYPLISYVSKAALRASSIDRVYVNTESSEIAAVAKTTGVEVYWRAARLAAGPVTTDEISTSISSCSSCRERKPSLNMSVAGIVSTYRRLLSFLCPASSVSISTRKMTSYSQKQ